MRPVIRRNPNWMPSVFNDLFDTNWVEKVESTSPAINVMENENEYQVEIAAPGLTKEDFTIKLDEEKNLVITMEKKTETKEENEENKEKVRYLRRDFSYKKFQQKMVLSDNVVSDAISAKMENGVLNVFIPKAKPEDNKKTEKQIEIL